MLTIENLDAGYRRVRVLYDVTLSIGAGETVGIIGKTLPERRLGDHSPVRIERGERLHHGGVHGRFLWKGGRTV